MTFKIMKNEEYHKVDALSSTALKELIKGIPYFNAFKTTKRKTTPDMLIGSATHSMVLEPNKFKNDFITYQGIITSEKNQELLSLPENINKTPITVSQAEMADQLSKAILYHGKAVELLNNSHKECSLFVSEKEFKFPMKARYDFINMDKKYFGDIKTIKKSVYDDKNILYYCKDYGVDIQLFFYKYCLSMLNPKYSEFSAYVIYVSKENELLGTPDSVKIYHYDTKEIDKVGEFVMQYFAKYAECMASNKFTGYTQDITEGMFFDRV